MSAARTPFDFQVKIYMVGDSSKNKTSYHIESYLSSNIFQSLGVGKTCLMLKFSNGDFTTTFISTIGIDFKAKNVVIDNKRVRVQVSISFYRQS
jgi:Ras-related protein Rab-8A